MFLHHCFNSIYYGSSPKKKNAPVQPFFLGLSSWFLILACRSNSRITNNSSRGSPNARLWIRKPSTGEDFYSPVHLVTYLPRSKHASTKQCRWQRPLSTTGRITMTVQHCCSHRTKTSHQHPFALPNGQSGEGNRTMRSKRDIHLASAVCSKTPDKTPTTSTLERILDD
jgi:hypothetical protein